MSQSVDIISYWLSKIILLNISHHKFHIFLDLTAKLYYKRHSLDKTLEYRKNPAKFHELSISISFKLVIETPDHV